MRKCIAVRGVNCGIEAVWPPQGRRHPPKEVRSIRREGMADYNPDPDHQRKVHHLDLCAGDPDPGSQVHNKATGLLSRGIQGAASEIGCSLCNTLKLL